MLHDRLVCGIMSEDIQKNLISDTNLTLTMALDITLADEAAVWQAIEIRGTVSSINCIKMKNNSSSPLQSNNYSNSKINLKKNKMCHRYGS